MNIQLVDYAYMHEEDPVCQIKTHCGVTVRVTPTCKLQHTIIGITVITNLQMLMQIMTVHDGMNVLNFLVAHGRGSLSEFGMKMSFMMM